MENLVFYALSSFLFYLALYAFSTTRKLKKTINSMEKILQQELEKNELLLKLQRSLNKKLYTPDDVKNLYFPIPEKKHE